MAKLNKAVMIRSLKMIVLMFCAQPEMAVAQSSNTADHRPIEESAKEPLRDNKVIDSLILQIKIQRKVFATLGERHPHYEDAQRELENLENRLKELIGDPPGKSEVEKPASELKSTTSQKPKSGHARFANKNHPTQSQQTSGVPGSNDKNSSFPEDSLKPVIDAGDFKFTGGWQLPAKGAGGKGLGFSRGGLFIEQTKKELRRAYLYGHRQAKELHVLEFQLDDRGTEISQRLKWPEAKPVQRFNDSHRIRANKPYDICRPNEGGPLLTTGRVFYATEPHHWVGPWMNWYDPSSGSFVPLSVENNVDRRQVFGGGFCDIPPWFSDQFLGGRDFGVGFGGYRSGQNSSPGPTFFAARRPKDFARTLTDCIELLSFRWEGEKQEREHRPADYTTPLFGPPSENGVGWWQADEVIAGPVWVDTNDRTGLCFWTIQGLGDLNYKLQSVAFSEQRRVRLYVYSPEDLVSVIRGQKQPHQIHGKFYDWNIPFDKSENAKRWPIGAYWHSGDQLLYMAYRNSGAGEYEIPPAIVAYKVR